MPKLKSGLQLRCVPALIGPWMHPVLSARDCSSREPLSVGVMSWTRHDRLCSIPGFLPGPDASINAVPVPMMVLLQFRCLLGHSCSRCGPALSCRCSSRPGGERSQVWPSVKLLDNSPLWSGLSAAASPGPAAVQCADAHL